MKIFSSPQQALKPLILIIDDLPDNLAVLAHALGELYQVQIAATGAQGLAYAQQNPPDLILLDMLIPEMNGWQVFTHLREHPKTRSIPVIFVTAQNDSQNETRALEAGAADFISKPINPDVVRARIRTQLTLRKRQIQYQRLNSELESRVKERTRQVEALNAALEERAIQAEAANQTKALFLGNVSHELRTPMSAILGFSDLLQQKITDPDLLAQLQNIRKAGNQLLTTINNILHFSRIESGKLSKISTDFNLENIFVRVAQANAEAIASKKLNYHNQIDPAIPAHLCGDPEKVEQILLNLTSNAIKFTSAGSVSVIAKLEAQESEKISIRLEVKDTGIGLTAAKANQIFKPFNQADNSLTRKYGGLGLGLSITHNLVKIMGGQMGANSLVGKGCTFWVNLKFDAGKPTLPVNSAKLLQTLQNLPRKPKILMVEDDFFNQSIFSFLLAEAHLNFDIANNGAEAVKWANTQPYDLILMDVEMPVMDGLTATRQIRSQSLNQHTVIIAISARAFDEDLEKCQAAGMNHFVAKPIVPETFYAELCSWLVD